MSKGRSRNVSCTVTCYKAVMDWTQAKVGAENHTTSGYCIDFARPGALVCVRALELSVCQRCAESRRIRPRTEIHSGGLNGRSSAIQFLPEKLRYVAPDYFVKCSLFTTKLYIKLKDCTHCTRRIDDKINFSCSCPTLSLPF